MTPSEIRVELLGHHAALRRMIRETCNVAERAQQSDLPREELHALAVRVADSLRAHNRREEELLRGIIVAVDAWGPARDAVLSEEHVNEHDELEAVIALADSESDVAGAACLIAVLNRVLDHMTREEKAVLGEDLLRDDAVVIDYFGG